MFTEIRTLPRAEVGVNRWLGPTSSSSAQRASRRRARIVAATVRTARIARSRPDDGQRDRRTSRRATPDGVPPLSRRAHPVRGVLGTLGGAEPGARSVCLGGRAAIPKSDCASRSPRSIAFYDWTEGMVGNLLRDLPDSPRAARGRRAVPRLLGVASATCSNAAGRYGDASARAPRRRSGTRSSSRRGTRSSVARDSRMPLQSRRWSVSRASLRCARDRSDRRAPGCARCGAPGRARARELPRQGAQPRLHRHRRRRRSAHRRGRLRGRDLRADGRGRRRRKACAGSMPVWEAIG